MAVVLGLALVALTIAAARRWRCYGDLDLEGAVVIAAAVMVAAGIAAVVLGTLGALRPGPLAAAIALVAAIAMPWRTGAGSLRRVTRPGLGTGALLLACAALRWPTIDHALAGRDQGTYVLRAESTARTGSFDVVDPIVRDAVGAEPQRPDTADLAGLYPRRGEAWRDDVYEAGYRPGWYLADRERGRVVPQFLHLHPALLTIALWLGGRAGPGVLVMLQGVAAIAALLAVARRLVPAGPWPSIAAAGFALTPLAIWVHRNTLTEALTGLLTLCAVLGCLRARAGGDRSLVVAAAMLGATAWVRGNAWITAPVVLAVLWVLPWGAGRARAVVVYVAVLGAGVLLHAATVFPYLYDELARQFTAVSKPSGIAIGIAFAVGIAGWWSVDEIVFGPRSRHGAAIGAWVRPRLPWALGAGLLGALAAWAIRSAGTAGAPWSRLDALVPGVGIWLLVPAAVGTLLALPGWTRRTSTAADVWLIAIAALVVTTLWAYAGRNLPRFGLYYYGRYLVPEVLPLAWLAAAFAMARVHAAITRRVAGGLGRRGAAVVVGAAAMALLGVTAWPLFVTPTLLREYDGAGRIVDAIADRVPEDAIVIAGGEGWHSGHTFNQVAGALAMRHGRAVVPYASRELAYATLHALLVDGPAATGAAAPRVFVLVNEATHVLAAPVRGEPVAALDDGMPPPFVARSVALFELISDRLTPTHDALPTAITRDALRMALLEVVVDPAAAVRRIPLGAGVDTPGIRINGAADGCLSATESVEITIDEGTAVGVAVVVLVADPEHAAAVDGWQIAIDGEPRDTRVTGVPARARATLGPFATPQGVRSITVRGAARADASARCPHGALTELRLLGPEQRALDHAPIESVVLEPPRDLGHRVTPVRWVSGRGLSRARPQLVVPPAEPVPARATSLELTAATPIAWVPEPLSPGRYDVVVNLTAAQLSTAARIRVWADGALVGELDPPEARSRSWQSPPLPFTATATATRWRLELVGAGADDVAMVRDLGAFSRHD